MGVRRAKLGCAHIVLGEILRDYTEETKKRADIEVEKCAKSFLRDVRAQAPRRTGEYAKGLTMRRDIDFDSTVYTIYAGKKPGLAHLLEHGHVCSNGRRVFGRVKAYPHWTPAYDKHVATFIERLGNAL